MYVLVLRDTEAKTSRVWQGRIARDVIGRAARFMRHRPQGRWSDRTNEFILQNYGTMSAEAIAEQLSKQMGRKVTKNAVIGRYHRIKNHALE